ncbi:MAG: SHOCT domain-containing protein [Streptosporangiales bacterium]
MPDSGDDPDRGDEAAASEAKKLLIRYIDGAISREEYDARIADLNPKPQPSTYAPGTPEYEVAQVEASMHFEDIWLTPEERELLLRRARGEITRAEYDALAEERVFGQRLTQRDDQEPG